MCNLRRKAFFVGLPIVFSLAFILAIGPGMPEVMAEEWERITDWEVEENCVYAGGEYLFVEKSHDIDNKHFYMYEGTPLTWKKLRLPRCKCFNLDNTEFAIDKDTGQLYLYSNTRIFKYDVTNHSWEQIADKNSLTFLSIFKRILKLYVRGDKIFAKVRVTGPHGQSNDIFGYTGNPMAWAAYLLDYYNECYFAVDSTGTIYGAFEEHNDPGRYKIKFYSQLLGSWNPISEDTYLFGGISAGGNKLYFQESYRPHPNERDSGGDIYLYDRTSWREISRQWRYTGDLEVGSDGVLYMKRVAGSRYWKFINTFWHQISNPTGIPEISRIYVGNSSDGSPKMYVYYNKHLWAPKQMLAPNLPTWPGR